MSGERTLRRLWREVRGVAAIEFALSVPLLLAAGSYGVELSNYALIHMRVSQIALGLADNASRVGLTSNLSTQQLRETDVNDVLQGARLQGTGFALTTHGRVTVSSIRMNANGGQTIEWQRCMGLPATAAFESSYGQQGDGATGTSFTGMGDAGFRVAAPSATTAVVFVEINYTYQPLFGTRLIGQPRIHYVASFIVRDQRTAGAPTNPAPVVVASTCDRHTV